MARVRILPALWDQQPPLWDLSSWAPWAHAVAISWDEIEGRGETFARSLDLTAQEPAAICGLGSKPDHSPGAGQVESLRSLADPTGGFSEDHIYAVE